MRTQRLLPSHEMALGRPWNTADTARLHVGEYGATWSVQWADGAESMPVHDDDVARARADLLRLGFRL